MASPSPGSAAAIAVAVDDLHVTRGGHPALIGLRWQLPAGCVAAVFGGTGAGKSTLLGVLAGVIAPERGRVTVGGGDPREAASRALLGYMPQTAGLYADLSVAENLRAFAAGAGVRGALDDLLERTLELVELRQRRNQPVGELSAGQQRRASLGAALIAQPQVLLLDDPYAFADGALAAKLARHFAAIAASGRTVLYATARADEAARADRVAVLRAGRLLCEALPAELAGPYAARVLLRYREKGVTRPLELEFQDYRSELLQRLASDPTRPVALELFPLTAADALERLLVEETPHGPRG